MAEITSFADPKVFKEQEKYLANVNKINKAYEQSHKQNKKLIEATRKNEKTQKDLDQVTIQGNKLLKQNNVLNAKKSKSLDNLTKANLKLKEQEKQRIARLKQEVGITKKRNGLLKSMTTSILAAGAAMVGFNAVLKLGKKALETVFLGTQSNIDFFRVKLAGLKAEFTVLKDRASEFGEAMRKAFKVDEPKEAVRNLTLLERALSTIVGKDGALALAGTLFKDVNKEMVEEGRIAQELEQRLINLERAYADVELANSKRRRTIAELRLLAESDNETYKVRIDSLREAARLEKETADARLKNNREQIAIALAVNDITDEQIEKIVEQGLKIEQVGISISKETDRVAVIQQITKFYDDQTQSLLKQKKLLANINTLVDEQAARTKKSVTAQSDLENIEALRAKQAESSLEQSENLTITRKSQLERIEEWEKAHTEFIKNEEDKRNAYKKLVRQEFVQSSIEIGNVLFDIGQAQRDRELAAIGDEYNAKIAAAEGNKDLQERLAQELEQKQREIQREQAQSERNQALFNIAVNTAQSISATAATLGFPAAIPFIALAGALGIAQTAAVLSQPLPEFFMGTSDSPANFIAGDRGEELIFRPDGQVELTPNKPTVYSGKEYEHSTIIPNAETQRMLAGQATGESNKELLDELRLTRRAIERNRPVVNIARNIGRIDESYFKRKYKV